MARPYDDMTRDDLIAELRRRDQSDETGHLQAELAVHQEELRAHVEQLHHTQSLLEASRDEYVQLYDFAPVCYLTLDGNGTVLAINLTGCALFQLERVRILDYPLISFIDEAHRTRFFDHMRRCRHGEPQVATELMLKTRSGSKVPALVISQHSDSNAYRTVILDRSEQQRADRSIRELNASLENRVRERTHELERTNERLQQEIDQRMAAESALKRASDRKDEFLAMLGHELRNPLGPIRNAAVLMKMVAGDPVKLDELSDMIERQVRHMSRIVDDLLDISRITQGKIGLLREPLNLTEVLRQSLDDFRPSLEAEQISMQIELPPSPLWIDGDPARIAQIMGNLLHNSRKFTDPGGEVTISLKYLPALDEALITIRDTGIGIDSETLQRLFEPFTQADRSLDRSRGGLGLGLALVRGLVDLHGGSIFATSAGIGTGAQFTIRLPARRQPELKTDASSPATSDDPPPMSILIIEDQQDCAQTMGRLLASFGHQIDIAFDGEEGVRLAKEKRPQIVFSDIGLPGMNGYEVAKTLRKELNDDKLVMVAISGYGQDDDTRRALGAGFDRHLVKPVRFEDLQQIVKRAPAASENASRITVALNSSAGTR